MTGERRKKIRKEKRASLIEKRRRDQKEDKEIDQFIFELSGKPVRHNPKSYKKGLS